MPQDEVKHVLVIDEDTKFWHDLRISLGERVDVELMGAELLSSSPPDLAGFDLVIVHQHLSGDSSHGPLFALTARQNQPADVFLVNNLQEDEDRHTFVVDRQRAWDQSGLGDKLKIAGVYRLGEYTAERVLSLCDTFRPLKEDAVIETQCLNAYNKVPMPIRIIHDQERWYWVNDHWIWPYDDLRAEMHNDASRILSLRGNGEDSENTKLFQVEQQESFGLRIQAAVPYSGSPMVGEIETIKGMAELLKNLGCRRGRYYQVHQTAGAKGTRFPPVLNLHFAFGHDDHPTEENIELATREGSIHDDIFPGILPTSILSFWLDRATDDNLTRMLKTTQGAYDKAYRHNIDGTVSVLNQDAVAEYEQLKLHLGDKPPPPDSAPYEVHRLFHVDTDLAPIYLPIFSRNKRGTHRLEALLVVDAGATDKPPDELQGRIHRSQGFILERIARLRVLRLEERAKEKNEMRSSAFAFLQRIGKLKAKRENSLKIRELFLDACLEEPRFSLTAIAWHAPGERDTQVTDIQLKVDCYESDEEQELKALEGGTVDRNRLPALFDSIDTNCEVFWHRPLDNQKNPHDINGLKPRFALPLDPGMGFKMRGALGISQNSAGRPFLESEVQRIRELSRVFTPFLYLLQDTLRREDGLHSINHEINDIERDIENLLKAVDAKQANMLDNKFRMVRKSLVVELGETPPKTFSLMELIEEERAGFFKYAKASHKTPRWDVPELAGDCHGFGLPERFSIILNNLLRNAVRHGEKTTRSNKRGLHIEAKVTASCDDDKMVIRISNPGEIAGYGTGQEIPEEAFRKLRPPQRENSSSRHGLTTVFSYVRHERAELTLSNRELDGVCHVVAELRWPVVPIAETE